MWKDLLNRVLGGQKPPDPLSVPELPSDKPDYTPVLLAGVAVLAILAVLWFITKK